MSPRRHRQFILKGLVVALSTWLVAGLSASAHTVAVRRIVVRSYNTFGVPLPTLDHAASTASDLLRAAGIDSSWRNCRTADGPSLHAHDVCREVLNASEVIVRIVGVPRAVTDADVLGYSHVDAYRRQGTLATVFADRVRVLAPALGVDEGTLLGRAITHELGHLLLGTLEHSETGVMRGAWTTAGRRQADWFFSSGEATRMRAGLEARWLSAPIAVARARSSR